jgi:hypothetical protein
MSLGDHAGDGVPDDWGRVRPAPRCYTRKAKPKVVSRSRLDAGSNGAVLTLSVLTGVAAFLAVYGGWSF